MKTHFFVLLSSEITCAGTANKELTFPWMYHFLLWFPGYSALSLSLSLSFTLPGVKGAGLTVTSRFCVAANIWESAASHWPVEKDSLSLLSTCGNTLFGHSSTEVSFLCSFSFFCCLKSGTILSLSLRSPWTCLTKTVIVRPFFFVPFVQFFILLFFLYFFWFCMFL